MGLKCHHISVFGLEEIFLKQLNCVEPFCEQELSMSCFYHFSSCHKMCIGNCLFSHVVTLWYRTLWEVRFVEEFNDCLCVWCMKPAAVEDRRKESKPTRSCSENHRQLTTVWSHWQGMSQACPHCFLYNSAAVCLWCGWYLVFIQWIVEDLTSDEVVASLIVVCSPTWFTVLYLI